MADPAEYYLGRPSSGVRIALIDMPAYVAHTASRLCWLAGQAEHLGLTEQFPADARAAIAALDRWAAQLRQNVGAEVAGSVTARVSSGDLITSAPTSTTLGGNS